MIEKIVIDEQSGFCFGVVNAITHAEKALGERGELYSLGDIVHNGSEVSRLEKMGLVTISHADIPSLAGRTMLIRAHGEPPTTYRLAEAHGVEIIDATCPVVARLQRLVVEAYKQMSQVDGQVVIFGKRGHAEVVGLTGQIDEKAIVVEGVDDLSKIDFARPIFLLSQTTQSSSLFQQIREYVLSHAADPAQVVIRDTICGRVSGREGHLREFASQHDVIIFVCGQKSSNGKVLYEVCRMANPRSYKVEDASQLRPEWFAECRSVGVCGATSTPLRLMEEVSERVSKERCQETTEIDL